MYKGGGLIILSMKTIMTRRIISYYREAFTSTTYEIPIVIFCSNIVCELYQTSGNKHKFQICFAADSRLEFHTTSVNQCSICTIQQTLPFAVRDICSQLFLSSLTFYCCMITTFPPPCILVISIITVFPAVVVRPKTLRYPATILLNDAFLISINVASSSLFKR